MDHNNRRMTTMNYVLKYDKNNSIRSCFNDLFIQAEKRQKKNGKMYLEPLLRHLIGAKLEIIGLKVAHYGVFVTDQATKPMADFEIGDVAIHIAASLSEALIHKCAHNLNQNRRPIVITTKRLVPAVEGLLETMGIADRLDILDAEQFLAGNIFELGQFSQAGRRVKIRELIEEYNRIVETAETDPSLMIKMG
jgi:hypothetical protein